MNILVNGRSLGSRHVRLRRAVLGLAQRGHAVVWGGLEAPAPGPGGLPERVDPGEGPSGPRPSISEDPPPAAPWRRRVDLVLGGGGAPAGTAARGWLAGARAMLLAIEADARRWNPLERWCWESLDSVALVDPADRETVARARPELDPERCVLWSAEPAPPRPDPAHPDTEVLELACERALARHRGAARRPAAFLDRDGTLVVEKGYLARPEDLELIPGVPEALRQLRAAGFDLVVISNQSGVERGLFPLARVHQTMAELRRALRPHGVELDAVRFCPHRPDAGCACRKPGAGLLTAAARDLGIALRDSVMFGDKRLDVAAGHRAGARGILLRTGYGAQEAARAAGALETPEHVADDLRAAVRWLLGGDSRTAGA